MKKATALFFAFVMILSIAFVGEAISSDNSFSASAQTRTRRRTRKRPGWAKRQYNTGERGTRYSAHKTKRGTKYTYRKGKKGTKWTYRKGKHGTKKVVSRTKKIFS